MDPELFAALRGSLKRKDRTRFDRILFQHTVTAFMERVETALQQLLQGQTILMAKITDVDALISTLNTATNSVAAKIDTQITTIQALQAQIAAGGTVKESDLDPVLAQLSAVTQRLQAMGSNNSDPIPADAPE